MRTRFMSAYSQGRQFAIRAAYKRSNPEEVIFEARANNPMKGIQAQAQFIEGVSEYVNEIAAYRNHRMNEGA